MSKLKLVFQAIGGARRRACWRRGGGWALLLAGGFGTAAAQDLPVAEPLPAVVTLRLNALGFVNKARGQAEVTWGAVGAGLVGSYYYAGSFTGPKAEAYLRFYTSRRLAEGFYLQAKGGVGRYDCRPLFDRTVTSYDARGFLENVRVENDYDPGPQRVVAGGGGGGVGYQFRLGHGRRMVLDLYAGLQYVPLPKTLDSYSQTTRDASGRRTVAEYENFDALTEWYGLGPGSILNSMVSIGYTFGGQASGQVPGRWRRLGPAAPAPDAPVRKTSLRTSTRL